MPLSLRVFTLLALSVAPACAQQQKQSKMPEPVVALATDGLAGQLVAVLPLTMVVGDPAVPGTTGLEGAPPLRVGRLAAGRRSAGTRPRGAVDPSARALPHRRHGLAGCCPAPTRWASR